MQATKDKSESFLVLGLDASFCPFQEIPLQPAMAKCLDHGATVTCYVSGDKRFLFSGITSLIKIWRASGSTLDYWVLQSPMSVRKNYRRCALTTKLTFQREYVRIPFLLDLLDVARVSLKVLERAITIDQESNTVAVFAILAVKQKVRQRPPVEIVEIEELVRIRASFTRNDRPKRNEAGVLFV